MGDLSLSDIIGLLKNNFSSTNIGDNPGVYINPKAQLNYSSFGGPFGGLRQSQGWVQALPGLQNKINFSRQHLPNDQYGLMKLLAHESTHTTQNIGLGDLFKKSILSSAPYYHYSDKTDAPPEHEILASLRENEAIQPRGKSWVNSFAGEDYMERLRKANPKRDEQSIKQEIDRKMFPEFSVMHESPVNPQLQKQQGFLQQLMQMFGR